MIERFRCERPAYERYGAIRVGEGRYDEVIRYHEHVLPVRLAIGRIAGAAIGVTNDLAI